MAAQRKHLEGWTVESGSNGILLMTPHARPDRDGVLLLLLGLSFWVLSACAALATRLGAGMDQLVGPVVFVPLGAVFIWQGLWGRFGRKVWRVGLDLLEVHQRFFGYRRVCRYRAATLKLVHSTSRSYARLLRGFPMAADSALMPAGTESDWGRWSGLFVLHGHQKRCLQSSNDPRKVDLRTLGEFLADWTGWPLVIAERD